MVLYYGALIVFGLADKYYSTDGSLTVMGRAFAVVFVVIVFAVSTGAQRAEAIKTELGGAPITTLADFIWSRFEHVVFWGALGFAGYFLFKGRFWDGLVALGLPAWRGWLWLELRRLRVKSGEATSSGFWSVLLGFCAVSFLFALVRSYLFGMGPIFQLFGNEYHVYPAVIIASLAGIIFSLAGSGGDI